MKNEKSVMIREYNKNMELIKADLLPCPVCGRVPLMGTSVSKCARTSEVTVTYRLHCNHGASIEVVSRKSAADVAAQWNERAEVKA